MGDQEKPTGRLSASLPLCHHCAEYIREDFEPCPHCGQNPRELGGRYVDEGFHVQSAFDDLLTAMNKQRF